MVLCITHSADYYTIDIVQQHLQKLGIPSFRFNTDEFITGCRMRYSLQDNLPEYRLYTGSRILHASQITAVWYRKLWDFSLPEDLDPEYRDMVINEYSTHLQLFFNALRHLPWMNSMQAGEAVNADKLQQLIAAQQAGLAVPRTILTNEAAAVRELYAACNGQVVMKLHGALSKSMSGSAPFFPTTRITENDWQHIDRLVYCPMIFQEFIPKQYELRIAYVQGDFFAGKIPGSSHAPTDWRTITGGPIAWERYLLPVSVREQLCRLMEKLQLSFGAIDMIRHINGAYVFLEVNPQGEWGMLQRYLDYPIGETIAEKLARQV